MSTLPRVPLLLRLTLSAISAIWIYVFFPVMQQLGLLVNPKSFLWVLFVLVLLELVPSRWLKVGLAIIATYIYMWIFFRPQHKSVLRDVYSILTQEGKQFKVLLSFQMPADPLQTQLFLFIICILFVLVRFASLRSRLWIFYTLLGVLLLSVVDVNAHIRSNSAIVTVIAALFIVLGLLQMTHILQVPNRREVARWLIPLMAVTVISVGGAALVADVWSPSGADENNSDAATGDGATNSTSVQMIGYQLNDSSLGGPFQLSTTPALLVAETHPTYLRGQTLSFYTGKGWISAVLTDADTLSVSMGAKFPADFSQLPSLKNTQTVEILSGKVDTKYLLAGYSLQTVSKLPEAPSGALTMDEIQGNVLAPTLGKNQFYTVVSTQMENPYARLAAIRAAYSTEFAAIPSRIAMNDLQLPATLPERVQALAKRITRGKTTEYEMVSAVQSYLDADESYSNVDVAVPGPNQDYVDQFLFQTHVGYCNNFSSAMAVLLRTLNIPTRWVTGYTTGQLVSNQGTSQQYLVEDDDAHSWVEVYFPNYGWIPFDPTPGYTYRFAPNLMVTHPGANSQGHVKLPKSHPSQPTPKPTNPHPVTKHHYSPFRQSLVEWMVGVIAMALLCFGGAMVLRDTVMRNMVLRKRNRGSRLHKDAQRNLRAMTSTQTNSVMFEVLHDIMQGLIQEGYLTHRHVTLRDVCRYAARYGIEREEVSYLLQVVESHWYGKHSLQPEELTQVMNILERWRSHMHRLDV